MKVRHYLIPLFLSVALCPLAAVQAADTPPTGSWRGVFSNEQGRSVPAVLEFQSGRVRVNFDRPAACRIDASCVAKQADGYRYIFRPSVNGGSFCDRIYGSSFTIKENAKGGLDAAIPTKSTTWRGTLSASPRP